MRWILQTLGLTVMTASLWTTAFPQVIRVDLTGRSTLDRATPRLEPLLPVSPLRVDPPRIDTAGARFLAVFHPFGSGDPFVAIMALPTSEGELLYVDRDRDRNLANDGPPSLFPSGHNEIVIDLRNPIDSTGETGIVLMRTPRTVGLSDSTVAARIDEDGNLRPAYAAHAPSLMRPPEFEGRRGTFFWVDRLDLRRGRASVEGTAYDIGLWDRMGNGFFDDDSGLARDKIVVDGRHTGRLSGDGDSTVYDLHHPFPLGSRWYHATSVDRHGRWIEIEPSLPPGFFIHGPEYRDTFATVSRLIMDNSFWQLRLATIDGDTVQFQRYYGSPLLLNFWGEWCGPCMKEIDRLKARADSRDSLRPRIISFLFTMDLDAARDSIRRTGIRWPQFLLTPDLEELFAIREYPTNILIAPDGRVVVRMDQAIDGEFFTRRLDRPDSTDAITPKRH